MRALLLQQMTTIETHRDRARELDVIVRIVGVGDVNGFIQVDGLVERKDAPSDGQPNIAESVFRPEVKSTDWRRTPRRKGVEIRSDGGEVEIVNMLDGDVEKEVSARRVCRGLGFGD